MRKRIFPLNAALFFLAFLSAFSFSVDISSCQNLSTPNTVYNLTASPPVNSSTCFNITAENITINGGGYTITGNGSTGQYGVYSNATNTTVKNLIINNFQHGVLFNGTDNGTIQNNTINITHADGYAIYLLTGSTYNAITLNNATTDSTATVYLALAASFNNLSYNSFRALTGAGYGMYLYYSHNNTLLGNNITSVASRGVSATGITGNTFTNNIIDAQWTNNGLTLDAASNSNIFTGNNITAFRANAIALFQSHGNNFTDNNATVTSGVGSSFDAGISVWAGSNNTFIGGSSKGVAAIKAVNYSGSASTNNTFRNITLNGSSFSIMADEASGLNNFYYNNITGTGAWVNNSNSTNTFNTSIASKAQGNFYWNISSYAVADSDLDGWADTGSAHPLNGTNAPGAWIGSGADYGPSTSRIGACLNITAANQAYTLGSSISINGSTCFNITAANVTLNCAGYSITGNNTTSTYGVLSTAFNSTVKNCLISNFQHGIYFNTATNGTVQNTSSSTTHSSGFGIRLVTSSNNNLITNSTGTSTSSFGIYLESSSNNTIANSTGTSNSDIGIDLYSSSSNTISNSTGTSTSSFGIFLQLSSNNNLITNSTGTSTSSAGIYLDSSSSNTIANSTFRSNRTTSFYGAAYLASSSNSNLFSNNTINSTNTANNAMRAIYIESGSSNNFTNNTIVAAGGTTTAAIQAQAATSNNAFYYNNITANVWVNNSNSTNSFNTTIGGKGVGNIYYFTNGTGSWNTFNIIDSDGNNYADAGTDRPFNATTIGGNWSGLGGDWFPYSTVVLVVCQNITAPNTIVTMNQNITINGSTCFNITAANVTIDGAGYTITGNNTTATYGVYSNAFNTTIRNLIVRTFNSGIYFDGADNGTIRNNSVNTSKTGGYGIYLASSANSNTLANNTVAISDDKAIYLSSSSGNTIANNTATASSDDAISLDSSNNNTIRNNTATASNTNGIHLVRSSTNTIANNTATASTSGGIFLYLSHNNTISNNTAYAGLDYAIRLDTSSDNNVTGNNATAVRNYGIYFYATALRNLAENNNATVDSRGIEVAWASDSNTIRNNRVFANTSAVLMTTISGTNNTFTNNTINATDGGIALYTGTNNTFANNTINASQNAIYLSAVSSNNFTRNTLNSPSPAGSSVKLVSGADNNTLVNNTITTGAGYLAINISSSTGNRFYYNNITAGIWVNSTSDGNHFNITNAGNIYYFANGTASWSLFNITDANSDSWADVGSDRPFNNTTVSAYWGGYGSDYFPYTTGVSTLTLHSNITFANASAGHWFYANASANSSLGGAAITAAIASTNGTCVSFSNATSGNILTAVFNCSGSANQTVNVTITFNDTYNKSVNSTLSNTFPNNAPSISAVTITPATLYNFTNASCNVTATDADADTINYTYLWYLNGTANATTQNISTALLANASLICQAIANDTYNFASPANSSAKSVTHSTSNTFTVNASTNVTNSTQQFTYTNLSGNAVAIVNITNNTTITTPSNYTSGFVFVTNFSTSSGDLGGSSAFGLNILLGPANSSFSPNITVILNYSGLSAAVQTSIETANTAGYLRVKKCNDTGGSCETLTPYSVDATNNLIYVNISNFSTLGLYDATPASSSSTTTTTTTSGSTGGGSVSRGVPPPKAPETAEPAPQPAPETKTTITVPEEKPAPSAPTEEKKAPARKPAATPPAPAQAAPAPAAPAPAPQKGFDFLPIVLLIATIVVIGGAAAFFMLKPGKKKGI